MATTITPQAEIQLPLVTNLQLQVLIDALSRQTSHQYGVRTKARTEEEREAATQLYNDTVAFRFKLVDIQTANSVDRLDYRHRAFLDTGKKSKAISEINSAKTFSYDDVLTQIKAARRTKLPFAEINGFTFYIPTRLPDDLSIGFMIGTTRYSGKSIKLGGNIHLNVNAFWLAVEHVAAMKLAQMDKLGMFNA